MVAESRDFFFRAVRGETKVSSVHPPFGGAGGDNGSTGGLLPRAVALSLLAWAARVFHALT